MQKPFIFIDYSLTGRKEFRQGEGYQPTSAVFYLKSGEFLTDLGEGEMPVSAGDFFILPDYVYFKRKIIKPISFLYIKFKKNEKFPFGFNLPYGKVEIKNRERFNSTIDVLEKLLTAEDGAAVYLREHFLEDLLMQVVSENIEVDFGEKIDKLTDFTVKSALEWIGKNLDKKMSVKCICAAVGTNPSTLNFKFRKELKTSVWDYVSGQRLIKGRHLILTTNYSLSEVAERCGFENVYYFSNAFKKKFGISPSKYIKRFLGDFTQDEKIT